MTSGERIDSWLTPGVKGIGAASLLSDTGHEIPTALLPIQSFGNLAASGIAGVLWTVVSPRVAFGYLAGWMVIAIVLLRARLGK